MNPARKKKSNFQFFSIHLDRFPGFSHTQKTFKSITFANFFFKKMVEFWFPVGLGSDHPLSPSSPFFLLLWIEPTTRDYKLNTWGRRGWVGRNSIFPFKQVDTRLGLGKEKEVLDDGGAGNNKSVFPLALFLTLLNFPEGEVFFQLLPPFLCQCCFMMGILT